jgi:hypothetical protein
MIRLPTFLLAAFALPAALGAQTVDPPMKWEDTPAVRLNVPDGVAARLAPTGYATLTVDPPLMWEDTPDVRLDIPGSAPVVPMPPRAAPVEAAPPPLAIAKPMPRTAPPPPQMRVPPERPPQVHRDRWANAGVPYDVDERDHPRRDDRAYAERDRHFDDPLPYRDAEQAPGVTYSCRIIAGPPGPCGPDRDNWDYPPGTVITETIVTTPPVTTVRTYYLERVVRPARASGQGRVARPPCPAPKSAPR